MSFRRRYMISWKHGEHTGRGHWVLERKGKLSTADIKMLEKELGERYGSTTPVIITNYAQIN